jgi:hypothetical protein
MRLGPFGTRMMARAAVVESLIHVAQGSNVIGKMLDHIQADHGIERLPDVGNELPAMPLV